MGSGPGRGGFSPGAGALAVLAICWPGWAAAQGDGTAEPPSESAEGTGEAVAPAWATCERYWRLLDGDASVIVPAEDLRVLPYTSGVSVDFGADAVSPVAGQWVDPPQRTVSIGDAELSVGEDERIMSWVPMQSGALVVALVALALPDEGDGEAAEPTGFQLRSFRRGEAGFSAVTPGDPGASPALDLEFLRWAWRDAVESRFDDPDGANLRWQLSVIRDQLVLLPWRSYDCPGGSVEYCGWLDAMQSYSVDADGGLWASGGVPQQATLNGSNVLWGGVFHFDTDFVQVGDSLPVMRIRPTWSGTQGIGLEDEEGSGPQREGLRADRDRVVSPIRTYRRLAEHSWEWVEGDFSDFLVPDYTRAVLRGQRHRQEAMLVALGNLVLGLELLFGRENGRDPYSLLYWLTESGMLPPDIEDGEWPANAARVREMMVGIASLATSVQAEGSGSGAGDDLRARLRTLGDFGFCPSGDRDSSRYPDYESDLFSVHWYEPDPDSPTRLE